MCPGHRRGLERSTNPEAGSRNRWRSTAAQPSRSEGWLSDRVDNRTLLAVYYVLRGLSLLYLPFSFTSFQGLSLFAIFYGLDWIATVPPTVRICTQIFGREKGGMMYGWVSATHQVGGASAAFLGGVARGDFGGYFEAFLLAGVICMVGAGMVLMIGRGRMAPQLLTGAGNTA